MKRLPVLVTLIALSVFMCVLSGCSKDDTLTNTPQPSAEQLAIQTSLASSDYALPMEFHNDEQYEDPGVTGESSSYFVTQDGDDTLPWVRFHRMMRLLPRVEYLVQIPGSEGDGTADVRIINHLLGLFIVDNTDDHIRNPFSRPFASRAVTNVMARKIEDNWRIEKISPTDVASVNDGGTTIRIAWMKAEGSSHTFPMSTILSPDTLLSLHQLPAFAPGDTVRVQARAFNANEDGCWFFLHIHNRYAASVFHMRIPFVRDEFDPTLYRAAWVVPGGIELPRVFYMAVDGINWNTLFGDGTAVYNSRMWCVPCLIGYPQLVKE